MTCVREGDDEPKTKREMEKELKEAQEQKTTFIIICFKEKTFRKENVNPFAVLCSGTWLDEFVKSAITTLKDIDQAAKRGRIVERKETIIKKK